MALRDILDRQANSIEYVLHTHGIAARIDGGRLSPRLAHFHIELPPGVRPAQIAPIVPEVADSLGVVSCRLAPGDDGVYLEVPRPDPVPVRLLPLVQRVADVVPPVTAILGVDTEGTPLLLRLNSPDVEPAVVTGNHSAGKSSLLRGMALSLALHNSPDSLRLLLLDCTGDSITFRGLEGLPHLACPIATGSVEVMVSLRWALRVLERRASVLDDDELFFDEEVVSEAIFNSNPLSEPELTIIIDGADLLCNGSNRRAWDEAVEALSRLLASGSLHNIHVIVSAERPEMLRSVYSQWGARITGSMPSPDAARLATGVKGSGADNLLGAGDFLITLNAELIRFQAAAISQSDLQRAVALIRHCADEQRREEPGGRGLHNRSVAAETEYEEPLQLMRNWLGD
ncbi:MAG: hypothetical protein IVW55_00170 [Chloroflexi bacterium]|nr:hypothetical protein [Chloroflexota bacterium]